jgi:hypothetical protein
MLALDLSSAGARTALSWLAGERRSKMSVLVVVQGGNPKLVDLRDSSRCGSRRTRSSGSLIRWVTAD